MIEEQDLSGIYDPVTVQKTMGPPPNDVAQDQPADFPPPFQPQGYGGVGGMVQGAVQGARKLGSAALDMMSVPFTAADDLQLQRYMNALSEAETQVNSGEIHPRLGQRYKKEILQMLTPLQQRKQKTQQEEQAKALKQQVEQTMQQESIGFAIQNKHATASAQAFKDTTAQHVSPVTGDVEEFYQPEAGKWAPIPFDRANAEKDREFQMQTALADSSPGSEAVGDVLRRPRPEAPVPPRVNQDGTLTMTIKNGENVTTITRGADGRIVNQEGSSRGMVEGGPGYREAVAREAPREELPPEQTDALMKEAMKAYPDLKLPQPRNAHEAVTYRGLQAQNMKARNDFFHQLKKYELDTQLAQKRTEGTMTAIGARAQLAEEVAAKRQYAAERAKEARQTASDDFLKMRKQAKAELTTKEHAPTADEITAHARYLMEEHTMHLESLKPKKDSPAQPPVANKEQNAQAIQEFEAAKTTLAQAQLPPGQKEIFAKQIGEAQELLQTHGSFAKMPETAKAHFVMVKARMRGLATPQPAAPKPLTPLNPLGY